MIEVNNISFKYAGQKNLVFDDFSLELKQDNIYGLLGKNGTGKSTLLYLISGLLRPKKGSVSFDGIETKLRKPETLQDIFIVPEEFDLPAISLDEYVKINRPFYPLFSTTVLEGCLKDFELTSDVKLNALSMGQKKKVFMAFALATNTKVLLMDEPTNGLDIPSKSQFRKVVTQYMTGDRTLIISTHQVHDVESLLDHILILSPQKLLLNASVADIQDKYTFEYRTPAEMDDVLYAEPSLQGNAVIAPRREDSPETKLAMWSLRNDRSYYVRSFLQIFAVQTLMFLFFTTGVLKINNNSGNYSACGVITIMFFLITFLIGPSTMFYSLKGKHDKQALMLLPASNFEKYLMRYSTWIIILPIGVVASLGADLIQYVVNWLMGHPYTSFVFTRVFELIGKGLDALNAQELNSFVICNMWLHSIYAIGGSFFRSRKYTWVLTTLVIIVIGLLMAWVMPESSNDNAQTPTHVMAIADAITAILVLVNFWLSYRCFCRTQNIGRFINF